MPKPKIKIQTYGVNPKKKVEEIAIKFNHKKWILPGVLLLFIISGTIFTWFSAESENRYEDLEINEQQAKENEVVESPNNDIDITDLVGSVFGVVPLIIVTVVIITIITLFLRRRW